MYGTAGWKEEVDVGGVDNNNNKTTTTDDDDD
jgi:hypothetical protein